MAANALVKSSATALIGLRNLFKPSGLLNHNLIRLPGGPVRNLVTTTPCFVKEITANETGDTIIIEGKSVPSPREKYLANLPTNSTACTECPLCRLGLTVRHTDVLIISQFVNSKGKMLPRDVTGLCRQQHKRMKYLVVMAEKAGLIERDVVREVVYRGEVLYAPEEWEGPNYNKYYDETVIDEFLEGRRKRH